MRASRSCSPAFPCAFYLPIGLCAFVSRPCPPRHALGTHYSHNYNWVALLICAPAFWPPRLCPRAPPRCSYTSPFGSFLHALPGPYSPFGGSLRIHSTLRYCASSRPSRPHRTTSLRLRAATRASYRRQQVRLVRPHCCITNFS